MRRKVEPNNGLSIVSEALAASQISGRRACVTKESLDVLPSVHAFFSSALVYNQCSGLIGEALKAQRSELWPISWPHSQLPRDSTEHPLVCFHQLTAYPPPGLET